MIDKPTIVIASLGRTGTKFFCALFKEIVPDCTSLHEPDSFHIGKGNGIRRVLDQTREAGVYNMFVRKALGQWGLANVSHARVRGELSYAGAVRQVLSQRAKFVHNRKGSLYVESSLAYYGLLDVLRDVYERHRAVYIIRNGRDWVRSKMNRGQMYNRGRIVGVFAHRWPEAAEFESDPYRLEWGTMPRFDRLCWAWVKLNEYALATTRENPNAKVFRFERIFESEDRYQYLADLVEFVTTIPNAEAITTGSLDGRLDKRINVGVGLFPSWEEWPPEYKQRFETICGPLMEKMGYELG
jgi:hypothetical protein